MTEKPKYELIDKDGKKRAEAALASDLILYAERLWPGEEQDPERSGNGWSVQEVVNG